MTFSIKTIFLKENEKNIFDSLQVQGIDTSKFEHHFIDLFNKMYNNEVGYYIFEQDEQVYKIIILPKTIDEKSPTAQKEFMDYLLHYHRVNNKYNFDKTKQIPNSLLSLAFEANNQEDNNSHNPIEEFEYYKYKSIIDKIELFFKQHKNYKKVQIDYKSQDIKYKLNLLKNIKELDNTKIHQIKMVDMLYSQIATISYEALKLFTKKRIETIKDTIYQRELNQNTKKVMSFISKKYTLDKSYKFALSKLNNFKASKIFSKKSATKLLLVNIKSLFGFEQMYNDKEISVNNRYDLKTTSFFINPTLFYEWYVYDILKDFASKNKYKILFDKHNETTTLYDLNSLKNREQSIHKSSNPDYILINKIDDINIKIVLDAKWKNISNLGKINSNDFLKLQRDALLLQDQISKTISYLIYPNYLNDEDYITTSKNDNLMFNFGILQIDMNFDKEKNNIDFKYDFEKIEKQIEKEKYENLVQANFEKLTNDIDIYRSKLITQLLNSDNLENKEEVFNELDNLLLESAEKLSEKIEEGISPEIQEILEQYNEILEEDSKKFLKSSSLIYEHYKNNEYKHFDYSMPGSGLWKLVELELNTSFIWYIRIKNGVCNNINCFTPILSKEIERNISRIKLNEYDKNGLMLKGLMLGDIKFLSKNNIVRGYFDNSFISNNLSNFLQKIIDTRNENAHIKAMKIGEFNELYDFLFGKNDYLKKLLDTKKTIKYTIKTIS